MGLLSKLFRWTKADEKALERMDLFDGDDPYGDEDEEEWEDGKYLSPFSDEDEEDEEDF